MRIACIIPTYNGRAELKRLFNSLRAQTALFDVIIVDSSSNDGTLQLAEEWFGRITIISSKEFNHGGTRQLMVDAYPQYDFYVFLTQDACLLDSDAIDRLVEPFSDPKVGAVCGRQLPHLDATPLAQHARYFNYPALTQIKVMSDAPRLGVKTAFMSNSFAAYRGVALKRVGGFPKHVIFAEDMFVTAKMLLDGWKVVYAGGAQCLHSHNYTIIQEFQRYFDMGVFHARESWIRGYFGGAGGEGIRYVKSELKFLGFQRIYLWPSAIFRNAVKLLGYKLGLYEAKLPIVFKRKLSMYKGYWDGPFADSRECGVQK
ncbi:MAG: rhamnosyltransferase [Polynucleobacter sp. 39-45-136]|jgi:rhamnosyltransferase|nr:MAG: rhamnosyltransferase [Polynucleobacter sp. 39-45-136]